MELSKQARKVILDKFESDFSPKVRELVKDCNESIQSGIERDIIDIEEMLSGNNPVYDFQLNARIDNLKSRAAYAKSGYYDRVEGNTWHVNTK